MFLGYSLVLLLLSRLDEELDRDLAEEILRILQRLPIGGQDGLHVRHPRLLVEQCVVEQQDLSGQAEFLIVQVGFVHLVRGRLRTGLGRAPAACAARLLAPERCGISGPEMKPSVNFRKILNRYHCPRYLDTLLLGVGLGVFDELAATSWLSKMGRLKTALISPSEIASFV